MSINGLIVGGYYFSDYSPKAYKFSGGVYTDISPPGSVQSTALDVNDAGDIVGWFKNSSGNEHGYLLHSGIYTAIDVPGALATYALGNNNAGMIVGFYLDAGGVYRGFTLSPGGVFETIMYPGSTLTQVSDISDGGTLVGSYNGHGFIATPSTPDYQVCKLYDSTKAVKSGATIPIKIQLCGENGTNLSSANIVLHVTSVVRISTNASVEIQDAGNANPDSDFRFDPTLGGVGGGYIFNFKTTGFLAGTYRVSFTAGTGPATYFTDFQVR